MAILDWLPRVLVVLTFGCMPAVCSSQATVAPAAHTLAGQVVDSVTGQPIARALVRAGNRDGLTDHEGRFALDNIKETVPVPMASKPGYFPEGGLFAASGPVLLRLTPEAILYGTVKDANAQPVQHLQMQLRRLLVRAGLAYWQRTQATKTNAEGEFRFAELTAGKYSLATGFMVDGLPDAASSLAFVPTVYPPAGSEDAGDAITLRAGEHVEAPLKLTADKLYPVSGVVHGSIGQFTSLSVTTLEGLTVNPDLHFFTESGVFRCRLASGSYRLKADGGNAGENQGFQGTREITVGPAGLEGVSIVLAPLPSIPVEVEYQHSGAREQETPSPSFLILTLAGADAAADSNDAFGELPAQPVHADSGRAPQPGAPLVFGPVPPDHYVLQADIPAPWYLASASCGNFDLTRDPLVVSEGAGACSMRLVMRDDSATLQWSAPNPGTSVTVMAFPLANLAQTVGGINLSSGSNGDRVAGTVAGLAPGRYLVIAARHSLNVPYRDPEAFKKYLPLGKEVNVVANSQPEIELQVAPESDVEETPGEPLGEP